MANCFASAGLAPLPAALSAEVGLTSQSRNTFGSGQTIGSRFLEQLQHLDQLVLQ